MKQSWVVGIIMIYVILQGLTMVVQTSTTGESSVWSILHNMYAVNLTQNVVISAVSSIFAAAGVVLAIFATLLQMIFLYYPALFSGVYLWFWFVVCFPIACGFVVSIVSVIRGVPAAG